MRYPTIHGFDGNDLETQGYGALSDCISAEVTEELNGGFTLEMKYPLHGIHNEYLIPGNIIMAKPSHNQSIQPFRIHQVKRSFGSSIVVYANHISYDMSGYPIRSARNYNSLAETIAAMNAFDWSSTAGAAAYHKFTFETDKTSSAAFSIAGTQTLRSWMGGQEGSILDTYGGEWSYDNFKCFLASRRGEDNGIRISYGKNLAEYVKEQNNSVYSHICAYYVKNEEAVYSDFVETGAICAFRVLYYDASKYFDNAPTVAQLNTIAATQKPNESQTITVTPAQIGDVIGLGDTVYICYENVFTTRVIKTVWNVLADNYTKLELGTKKAGITDTIKSLSGSGTTATPTDYVIQQGTSSGWYFKKWASGDYACWYRAEGISVDVTTAWQGKYYGSIAGVNFPITFVSLTSVNQTVEVDDGGETTSFYPCTLTKTSGAVLYRPNSKSGVTATYNIEARGRWK